MSRRKRYLLYTVVTLVITVSGFVVFQVLKPASKWPVPPREKPDNAQAHLARGAYLVENVAHCAHCHSPMQMDKFGYPAIEGKKYAGTHLMGHAEGLPGEMNPPNLTPYYLNRYSDEELFVALTQGVAKDGHVMFPMMPYKAYGMMDPNDVWAMIDYIRTLPRVESKLGPSAIDFPVSILVKLAQTEPRYSNFSSLKTPEALGGYYVNIAGCLECHSPENEKHEPDMTLAGAGGRAFILPNGATLKTPNITPHPDGLGNWTEERFVSRFKQYADSSYKTPTVSPGVMNTYMAWHYFSKMEVQDLKSMYAYLKTLKPQPGVIKTFTPAGQASKNKQPDALAQLKGM